MRRALLAVSLAALCAAPAAAQTNAQCDGYGGTLVRVANVCNAAIDGVAVFVPVAGALTTGGNPFLGSTGGLGGFPHLGITLRVNAAKVVIPDVNYDGNGTVVGAASKILAPAPLVEGALGIFRGLADGTLAIDLLGSAQLLPTKLIDNVHIDVNARRIGSIALGLGVGARVTLLGERGLRPALTATVARRTLPRIGVGDLVAGDRYTYASDLGATEYRAAAGERFGSLSLSAGLGWTAYSASATVQFVNPVTGATVPPIDFDVHDSRAVGFVDAGIASGPVYLIGEAGLQRGKDLKLGTTFSDNDPRKDRLFGSIGLRLGI